jgi:hypothetical protein
MDFRQTMLCKGIAAVLIVSCFASTIFAASPLTQLTALGIAIQTDSSSAATSTPNSVPAVAVTSSNTMSNTIGTAQVDATADAKTAIDGTLWYFAGCCIIGVILAYAIEPSPPATRLLGKSPDYVYAYTDAYKHAGKRIQTSKAWTGCATTVVVYLLIDVIALVAGK